MNKRVRKITSKEFYKDNLIKLILITLSVLFILLIASCFTKAKVSADSLSNSRKQVTSIRIEKGDSLWSIAQEYISEEYKSVNDYIDEIKASNGLFSDTIHEGSYIIVPYYVSVLSEDITYD